ncbi:MAG: hypothetical protein K2X76_11235 [Sphingomonas sp.]|nr:hypothetical protein [Sphingomonas sp.]
MSTAIATSTADFTSSNCGSHKGTATSSTGLAPGQAVTINGNADLSSCMTGPGNGAVYSIELQQDSGFYNYIITVLAQGPTGAFKSMYLHFTDETGDRYKLWIYSSRKQLHTLAYDSDKPNIVKIEWSDSD